MASEQHDRIGETYAALAPRLREAVARRFGSADLADDAVAEAFAQALRRGDEIRDPAAWIWTSAFAIARGIAGGSSTVPLPGNDVVASSDDEGYVDLLEALAALAPADRDLLVKTHVEGWRAADIARSIGVSSATIRSRILRANRRAQLLLALCVVATVVATVSLWAMLRTSTDPVEVREVPKPSADSQGTTDITAIDSKGGGNWECGPYRGEDDTPTWASSYDSDIYAAVADTANVALAPIIGHAFVAEPGTISLGGGSCGVGIRLVGAQQHGWMRVYDGPDGSWRLGGIDAGRTSLDQTQIVSNPAMSASRSWSAAAGASARVEFAPSAIQGAEVAPSAVMLWFPESTVSVILTFDGDSTSWTAPIPHDVSREERGWILVTWNDDVGRVVGMEMIEMGRG